jgi:hypothetical protein
MFGLVNSSFVTFSDASRVGCSSLVCFAKWHRKSGEHLRNVPCPSLPFPLPFDSLPLPPPHKPGVSCPPCPKLPCGNVSQSGRPPVSLALLRRRRRRSAVIRGGGVRLLLVRAALGGTYVRRLVAVPGSSGTSAPSRRRRRRRRRWWW